MQRNKLTLARETLQGLSVGDAIGEALNYRYEEVRERADFSLFRDGTVRYTDDTEMALAIFKVLELTQSIDEDSLALAFASRFRRDPDRGYGRMARRILREISQGEPWEPLSRNAFGGGSFGNGAAMRVAPIGGYFFEDLERVVEMAERSARVTHYHAEGIAGAIAVAVAVAVATELRDQTPRFVSTKIWDEVLVRTPSGEVRDRIGVARGLETAGAADAARRLGNGSQISAPDTVPFCLWSACRCLEDYREAILSTIEVGGDCDTNAAIVGAIVAAYRGEEAIPADWLRVREPLDFRL